MAPSNSKTESFRVHRFIPLIGRVQTCALFSETIAPDVSNTCVNHMFMFCSLDGSTINTSKKLDERAFPVRVRVTIPPGGLGQQINDLQAWLQTEIGGGQYAVHSYGGIGADAIGVYLRDLNGAQDLLRAFPALELADETESLTCSSPAQSLLWEGTELFGVCNLYYATLQIMPMHADNFLHFPKTAPKTSA